MSYNYDAIGQQTRAAGPQNHYGGIPAYMNAAGIKNEADPNSVNFKGAGKPERAPPRDATTGFYLPYPEGSGMEHKNVEIQKMNE